MNKRKYFVCTLLMIVITLVSSIGVTAATNPYGEWQTINGVTMRRCTWYAWKLAYERTGVSMPGFGNAAQWYDNARNAGYDVGEVARPNSIAVWTGAPNGWGHVGFVESVNNGTMHILEGGRSDCAGGIGSINLPTVVGSKRNYGTQTLKGYIYLKKDSNITYDDVGVNFVDNNNAGLFAWINNHGRGVVSEVGAYIWDNNGKLLKDHRERCGLNYSRIKQELNIWGETGLKLAPGREYTCQFYAISNGKTSYSNKKTFRITGSADTQKPVISEVEIRDLNSAGYTVVCKANDNVGVTNVKFPSWSLKNGQDDLIWGIGTRSGDTFSYRVNVSAHKRDRGNYRTHIYAYDAAGNYSIYQINAIYVTTTKYRNVTNGTYEIVSALNNSKAIDINGASKSDYARTILHDRHGGGNQKFKISYYGGGYYRLVASHSGKTLDVNGASSKSGTILQQYYWNRSKAQLFRFESAGNGYYYIRSKVGTYIDAKGAATTNGTPVWMYKLNRRNSQKWKLIYNA